MSSLWKESITLATAVILLPFLITSTIIPAIRQLMRLKIPDDDRFVVSHQNNGRNKEINRGAGSGTFVLGPPSQEGLSSDISNPRVLSDMGLAIPRPTRLLPALAGLGDPRNSIKSLVSCIRLSLPCIRGKLFGPLQSGCDAAAALRLCPSIRRSLRLILQLIYRC